MNIHLGYLHILRKKNPGTQKFSKNYEIHILPALSVVQQRKELSRNWQQNQHVF